MTKLSRPCLSVSWWEPTRLRLGSQEVAFIRHRSTDPDPRRMIDSKRDSGRRWLGCKPRSWSRLSSWRCFGQSRPGDERSDPRSCRRAAKATLLGLIDDALDAGWSFTRACSTLELNRGRTWRWQQRRAAGRLDNAPSGGDPIHGLLEWEIAEILALFDEWADVDRSHRKLAHRGSCEARVWVSPSTGDRVLARHGLVLQGDPRPPAR